MKLYIYHHCPKCLRTLMVANYKDLPLSIHYPLHSGKSGMASEDNGTAINLPEEKPPVLAVNDELSVSGLDAILSHLDEVGSVDKTIRAANAANTAIATLEHHRQTFDALIMPRAMALGLPEFTTGEAIDAYKQDKENTLGFDFTQAMADTKIHQPAAEAVLQWLPAPEKPSAHNGTISWDDVKIFPLLRNLSMVRGLNFPQALLDYMHEVAECTNTELYFAKAI
ncbi:MAG: hypothetical protein CMI08_13520 [Oceanospirillaceae bacterium]|uniref:glutaredoxin 2 n=1 Tax=unclassified Thalassolituus TaxID=2624967 RepID=UPI000C5001B6|nr:MULTISPECIES: glutaredoxin 2 [unclassified Thalassolituus]MAS24749.1 hypothetical protein [Oceanospirillaceae bacterium]MAY00192.1 hypothetical protein [Oceanospirillaceae bacterium]MBL33960.1 hypothetical protein [Oceanospirillaceae bacterium]MBS54239.1 hypothetical protein [Oceanospirillaceae bacterium]|tara:strand:- start:36 stop:710 length:675 start_codon:yes stop_codon:yes gene_type:complete